MSNEHLDDYEKVTDLLKDKDNNDYDKFSENESEKEQKFEKFDNNDNDIDKTVNPIDKTVDMINATIDTINATANTIHGMHDMTEDASETNEMIVTSNKTINQMTEMFDEPNKTVNKMTDNTKHDEIDKVMSTIGAADASTDKNGETSDYGGHYNDENDSGVDDESDNISTINANAASIANNEEPSDYKSHFNADNDGNNAITNKERNNTEDTEGVCYNDAVTTNSEAETVGNAASTDLKKPKIATEAGKEDQRRHRDAGCIQNVMIDNCGASNHQSGREAATSDSEAKGDLDGDLYQDHHVADHFVASVGGN